MIKSPRSKLSPRKQAELTNKEIDRIICSKIEELNNCETFKEWANLNKEIFVLKKNLFDKKRKIEAGHQPSSPKKGALFEKTQTLVVKGLKLNK